MNPLYPHPFPGYGNFVYLTTYEGEDIYYNKANPPGVNFFRHDGKQHDGRKGGFKLKGRWCEPPAGCPIPIINFPKPLYLYCRAYYNLQS